MIQDMTNAEIYGLTYALASAFNNEERYLPAKVNFFIQKNRSTLAQVVDTIEETRKKIIIHHGTPDQDGESYNIDPSNIEKVNKELADLLNISHEVNISKIKLSDLDGLDFTPGQMQALLFMIEED